LGLKFEQHVSHEDPLILLNFENEALFLALSCLLAYRDPVRVLYNGFVAFNDTLLAKGLTSY